MLKTFAATAAILSLIASPAFATSKPVEQAGSTTYHSTNTVNIPTSVSNSDNKNTNKNRNTNNNRVNSRNTNTNNNTSRGGNSNVNVGGDYYRAPASSAYAPSGNVTAKCQGWKSGGFQVIQFGVSGGGSHDVARCWNAEDAEWLVGMGCVNAALAVRAGNPVAQALQNNPCEGRRARR